MSKNQPGTVYLIGAGPGDPGLITVAGLRLLHSCDAVLYDNLVPDELVTTLSRRVERHYVGKRAGKPCFSQDEINILMVRLAREGRSVARLKGSDPLIFGRGSEEARYLKANNIPFEIVPGVTSGIAAAAYAGIPCTDRGESSFVLFVTGHKAIDKQVSSVPWDWVAKGAGGTIVIYMGVSEIGKIVARLLEHGLPGDLPAAAIERGTFPSQRVCTSTLQKLPDTVAAEGIRPPAIIVLGNVIKLRPLMEWFDGKPLLGVRVMVTRPADQARGMYQHLRDQGAEVLPYPTIAVEEYADADGWKLVDRVSAADGWLVFTSENGVHYFMRQFLGRSHDIRELSGFKIAVVGHGSARAVGSFHMKPDFIPTRATTKALAEQLAASRDWKGVAVVRVRGNLSTDNVDRALASAGAQVIPLTVYNTIFPSWPPELKEKLREYPPDVITFTSGTSVEGLFENLTENEVAALFAETKVLTIGPSTSQVARDHGLKVTIESPTHSIPAMIDELVAYSRDHSLRRTK